MHIGYELLDSRRGAEHQVGYHKLISNKHEWDITNSILYQLEFLAILRENFLW